MTDPLAQAATLVDRAKLLRSQQRFEPAARYVQQAIDGLTAALGSFDDADTNASDVYKRQRDEVARKLADCYGILGGILRRQELISTAAQTYERGSAIEQDSRFGIVDSYNLTNALLLTVLAAPESLDSQLGRIGQARETVALQVAGVRSCQWWAWADLGLLSLLSGQMEEARRAYQNFHGNGARATDYASTISVLRQSQERLRDLHPHVAERIQEAIGWLEADTPQD